MKPQLFIPLGRILVSHDVKRDRRERGSAATLRWRLSGTVFFLLFLSPLVLVPPAWSATCTLADFSNPNPAAFIATPGSTPPSVTLFDLSTNSARCSITAGIGNNPSHVAVIADSSLLFVENDGDATVSVISLADGSTQATLDLTLSGVAKGANGITGNLAISPDLTFAYVVAFPAPLPSPPPAPVIVRIGIVPGFNTSSLGLLPSTGTQAAGDIGISFLPDATKAYVAFDAGNTYEITVSPFSVSSIIAASGVTVSGGGVTVSASAGGSASGDFAYVVQTPSQTGANPIQIPISTNVPVKVGAITGQNACSQANTVTTSPDGAFAYYTCPVNNSVQVVNISQNQIINTINLSSSPTPLGIVATSDNSELAVANQNGSVILITSPTAATPTVSPFTGLGGALNGAVQRPIHPAISPNTAQNVPTSKTIQFTASTSYALSPGTTLTSTVWKVNGTVNGNSTVGTISTTGLYTAPATPPSPPTVTVTATVTSSEFPLKSLLYPSQSGSASVAVTVTPSQLAFTTIAQTLTAGACSTSITVQSQDSLGNPTSPNTTETLTLASSSGGTFYSDNACNSVVTTANIPTTANSVTFFYKDTKSGSPIITVTGSGSFVASSTQSETVNAGPATQLAITTQPGGGSGGTAWATQPVVTLEDAGGNPVMGTAQNVTFAIQNNAGPGGVLSGTTTVAVNTTTAQATFSGLSINKTGVGYTLTVTGSTVNTTAGVVVSIPFNITVGAAAKLAFTTSPSSSTGGVAFPTQPVATVTDAGGNTVSSTASITLAVTSGTPASGGPGTLSGTATVSASGGVATFSGLSINTVGTGYKLTATSSGLTSATSAASDITVATATQLVFQTQPSNSAAGSAITPAITVQIEDAGGNIVTGSSASVTVAIGANPGSGTLSGTLAQNGVNGVATFNNLSINKTGTGYTLAASSTGLTGATSNPFNITPGPPAKLVFTTTAQGQTTTLQPVSSGALGGNTTPLPSVFVAVQDANSNLVNTSSASIVITSSPTSVTGTTTVGAVNGVATFSNLQFTVAGTYTSLTAASTSLTSAVSNSFTLTSNITDSITSTFIKVKIEDLPSGVDTFTGIANGDPNSPSLGVTWLMATCSGNPVNTNAMTPCGQVALDGKYTPNSRVPLAPANTFTAQATAMADPSKMATTGPITITSAIQLTMPPSILNVLIGSSVDFTPNTAGGNVNLGAGASPNDLVQGVTLVVSGACIPPPNYVFAGNDGAGCGSFNGSQMSGPPVYTYTAPSVVPMASTCSPASSCLGTQNKASITVMATSLADPNQPSASTTFVISSNISFAITTGTDAQTLKNICNPYVYSSSDANFLSEITSDPCGFAAKTPIPTLAVGLGATLAISSPQGFGTVTALTWTPAGAFQSASGTQSVFMAPMTVPSTNNGSATITGYAVADFTKSAPFSIPIVASKLVPDNMSSPFLLTVPSGQSGTIVLDFMGPTSGSIDFSCPSAVSLPTPKCSPSTASASGTGTTVVTFSLSFASTGSGPVRPPIPPPPDLLEVLTIGVLFILAFTTRRRTPLRWGAPLPVNRATAALLLCLCVVAVTWAAACGQFSPPANKPPFPISGQGFVTVQAAPPAGSTTASDSLAIPVSQ